MNKLIVSIIVLLLILLALGLGYRFFNDDLNKAEETKDDIPVIEEIIEPTIEPEPTVEPEKTINTDMFYDLDSILILVNKKHDLPSDYEPNDLVKPNVKSNKSGLSLRQEAALAIEEMFNKALEDDITLVLGHLIDLIHINQNYIIIMSQKMVKKKQTNIVQNQDNLNIKQD